MSWGLKVFDHGSRERELLKIAAAVLTFKSPNGWRYYVDETYFDYGQDWKWTTVLCSGGSFGGYQALNPVEQEEILLGEESFEYMGAIADKVLSDKYCPDKVRNAG